MNRKEMERMARRKDILEAGLVLFAEKDFHEVTVDEIAERVGLSKGTLYLYFKNKDDLFFSIIEDKTEALFHQLESVIQGEEPYLKRLEDLIRAQLSFFDKHQPYFKIIHSEKTRMGDQDRYRFKAHMMKSFANYEGLLLKFIVEGQKQHVFRKMQPDLIANTLRGLLNAFTFKCIFTEGNASLVEETPNVLDLFLYGVKEQKR